MCAGVCVCRRVCVHGYVRAFGVYFVLCSEYLFAVPAHIPFFLSSNIIPISLWRITFYFQSRGGDMTHITVFHLPVFQGLGQTWACDLQPREKDLGIFEGEFLEKRCTHFLWGH